MNLCYYCIFILCRWPKLYFWQKNTWEALWEGCPPWVMVTWFVISHERECCCTVYCHDCDSVVGTRPWADLLATVNILRCQVTLSTNAKTTVWLADAGYFSPLMLCQVCTTALFSFWLFQRLFTWSGLQQVKHMLNCIKVRWQGQSRTFHLLTQKTTWLYVLDVSFGTFVWILADKMFLYTSAFILLLPSALTSSMNKSEPAPVAAIHAQTSQHPNKFCKKINN